METLIKNAKKEIISSNEEFCYVADDLEIAAGIWHGYLTAQQRLEIMKKYNITKSIKDAYKAVAKIMNK